MFSESFYFDGEITLKMDLEGGGHGLFESTILKSCLEG
jgi:hypothetical protein